MPNALEWQKKYLLLWGAYIGYRSWQKKYQNISVLALRNLMSKLRHSFDDFDDFISNFTVIFETNPSHSK